MADDSGTGGGAATLVLTVTPNPSIDLLFDTDSLVWDDANRMADPRRRPGGQGINVTRSVLALGRRSEAVTLIGGRTGEELEAVLEAEGTPLHAVHTTTGETRPFVAVRERASGRSMLLNARGPARTESDASALMAATVAAMRTLQPAWVACCGSLPAGFTPAFYADIAVEARGLGVRVVVDCDGVALRLACDAGVDLLVPNHHEAGRLLDQAVDGIDAACDAALALTRYGPTVAITLGAAGAVLASSGRCWRAVPPHVSAGSAVGAGDAFLAGLLVALDDGAGCAGALRTAVAAGSAVLLSAGATLIDPADQLRLIDRIDVAEVT